MCRFSGVFWQWQLLQLQTNLLKTVFIFQKGSPLCTRIASFKWWSRELFFLIGLEVQKPAGSSVGNAHLPLEKLSYILKLMKLPKNPILGQFASFYLLACCHQVLSKFEIKSCLKGQSSEIFYFVFFHEWAPPKRLT